MTTGQNLSRMWASRSKSACGALHAASGCSAGESAGASGEVGLGGTPAALPPNDQLKQPFSEDANIDGFLKGRCGVEFRAQGGTVSNKVHPVDLWDLLRKRVRDIELVKGFNHSGSAFESEEGLEEIRGRGMWPAVCSVRGT